MKRVALLSTLAIAGSLLFAAPVEALSCEDIHIESYNVDVRIGAEVYDIGDRARIGATVTRMDTGEPVDDAKVGVALAQDDDYVLVAMRRTDERGRASYKILLKRKHFEPGPVDVYVYAWKTTVDTVCLRVTEYGYEKVPDAFRIRG